MSACDPGQENHTFFWPPYVYGQEPPPDLPCMQCGMMWKDVVAGEQDAEEVKEPETVEELPAPSDNEGVCKRCAQPLDDHVWKDVPWAVALVDVPFCVAKEK